MAKEPRDFIIVTDMDPVEKDDFYLSREWEEHTDKPTMRKARKLQREGKLFVAFRAAALSYALYHQMDAEQIFIDDEKNKVMVCKSEIISDGFEDCWEDED
jgi:hypothetical protein